MGKTISAADKQILAEVVRLTQRKGLQGAVGGWKDFLKCHDGASGFVLSDPARRPRELLLAFLQTFKKEEQKAFKKMIRRLCDQNAMVQFMKDLDFESPEQRLVRLTLEHPHYMQHFSFPFFDEKWIDVPLGEVSEAMQSNSMIAVDCEMVLCQDGTEAVVKICAVDHNLEVKINELVNPGKAVADYRTPITGVSSEDLEGVTCCLADIQKSLKKLLSHGTILVGHALYNDLRALKVDHLRVIDTSYIFRFAALPTHSPALNTLCKVVLGFPVRGEGEPHNCLNDAQAAMKLVLAKLEGGYDNPIEFAGHDMPSIDLSRLFLHRIPIEVPAEELQKLFAGDYESIIESDVKIRGELYSTYAVFKSVMQANEAFSKIEALQTKDSSGRPQKQVFLKYGDGKITSLYIRRMTADVHFNGSDSSKRLVQCENDDPIRQQAGDGPIDIKRQKTCLYPCEHVKEIEMLRKEKEIEMLRKEKEIEMLRKEKEIEMLRKEKEIEMLRKEKEIELSRKETEMLREALHQREGEVKEIEMLREALHQRDEEVKEIEMLREALHQREEEIFNLQKALCRNLS